MNINQANNPIPPKNWFSRHMILGYVFLGLIFAGIVATIYWWNYSPTDNCTGEFCLDDRNSDRLCIQVIQKARNPQTGEVKDFPTPCDVPEGWEKVEAEQLDETANWKTYMNSSLGFSIKHPEGTAPIIELNDQYNRLVGFGMSKESHDFEIRLYKDTDPDMGVKYGFLGAKIESNNIVLGGITGFKAVSATGYCDGPGCGEPYVEFGARYNGDIYHLIFYKDVLMSNNENQILSTFKFK